MFLATVFRGNLDGLIAVTWEICWGKLEVFRGNLGIVSYDFCVNYDGDIFCRSEHNLWRYDHLMNRFISLTSQA